MFNFIHDLHIKQSMDVPKMSLHIWEDECGIPSFDPECLEIMTIFKINSKAFDVTYANFPQWRKVPIIQIDELEYTDCEFIINKLFILTDEGTDSHLKPKLAVLLHHYKKYFKDNFVDPFLFDCWLNNTNYKFVIEPWYLTVIPFPFNFMYLRERRGKFKQLLATKICSYPFKFFMDLQRDNACKCLNDFSTMLNDGRSYFLGSFPTSLDALIYAYLMVALNLPLPDNRLQCFIKQYSNLVNFVERMTKKYFPGISDELKYIDPVHEQVELASTETLTIAGLCVSVAMILFVYTHGIVHNK